MTLTTELLIFEASDKFRNDIGLPIPAFDLVLKADGIHAPVYYGKQLEAPHTHGYIFINWDNIEAHKAVINGPSYPEVLGGLESSLQAGGKTVIYHVKFSAPTVAFEKPVTEVAIMTLKAPENRAPVVDLLSKFSEASKQMLVFGQVLEDENKYILVGGWPSVEAHKEAAAKPEMAAAIDKLFSLAHKDHLYHTKLSQHRL